MPWDPTFESVETFKEFCPIWVEFVDFLAWLRGSIGDLAGNLGTPLFVPTSRNLGKVSNKVSVCWDVRLNPPENMVINVGAGLVVVSLNFRTYFGACFKCNGFGHFARSCPPSVSKVL